MRKATRRISAIAAVIAVAGVPAAAYADPTPPKSATHVTTHDLTITKSVDQPSQKLL